MGRYVAWKRSTRIGCEGCGDEEYGERHQDWILDAWHGAFQNGAPRLTDRRRVPRFIYQNMGQRYLQLCANIFLRDNLNFPTHFPFTGKIRTLLMEMVPSPCTFLKCHLTPLFSPLVRRYFMSLSTACRASERQLWSEEVLLVDKMSKRPPFYLPTKAELPRSSHTAEFFIRRRNVVILLLWVNDLNTSNG